MPLYDYTCRDCGAEFEALVRHYVEPACPSCGSNHLERSPSTFAVKTESTTMAARSKAVVERKKANKDRRIAEREAMENHHH